MSALTQGLKALKKVKEIDLKGLQVDLSNAHKPIECNSTGSIVIDYLIGGHKTETGEKRCPGVPKGWITEIYGPEGSGKTTLAIQTAISVQARGGSVVFLDYEHAFAPTYAMDLGLDVTDEDTFMLLAPRHWEEGAEVIQKMAQAGVDLIIVDSVAAMKPRRDIEDNAVTSTGQVGHLARLMSNFLPKIVGDLQKSGTSLILLNQLRSRIKTSMYDAGPDEDTAGGRALKYFCGLRIALKRVKSEYAQIESDLTGKAEKQPISNIIRAKIAKTKVSRHQGHQAEFVIRYGEGVDNVRSVIDIGEARKVVFRGGAWYTFAGAEGLEVKAQGKEGLREHLLQNPADFQALVSQIQSFSQEVQKLDRVVSDDEVFVEDIEELEENFEKGS
jgi:recombination protein RecA